MSERQIAIIGAGFSGTLLALHLLRHCSAATRVVLIERQSHFGLGQAYATGNPHHLLNVRAARMSAYSDRPLDFLSWLRHQAEVTGGVAPAGHIFAPRLSYGAYIRSLVTGEYKDGNERLQLVRGSVVRLAPAVGGWMMSLDGGRTLSADAVVLALGNFTPVAPRIATAGFYESRLFRPDPWRPEALAGLEPDEAVALIGTGLTSVDVVVSLLDLGHRGPIHAMSRRGLMPQRHVEGAAPRPAELPAFPASPVAMLRLVRTHVRRHVAAGGRWQDVVDLLRHYSHDLWQAMALEDRARFIRHLRPWWDVHRHRMAGGVADRVDAARASGQLRVVAGRIRDIVVEADQARITYAPRGTAAPASLTAARVINCTGPGCDYSRIDDPLVAGLVRDGIARPDALRLGLDVTATGAVRTRDGAIAANLFAVGPVTRAAFWEIIAVPDIRRQCEALASHVSHLPCMNGRRTIDSKSENP